MAAEKWKGWAVKEQEEAEPCVLLGRQLPEPGRFAYAALCGISLGWLFPENEHSSFRTEFIKGFVKWLDLPDAVLPAMTAFADGLGGEGTETFTEILLKDPILKENPLLITQVNGHLDYMKQMDTILKAVGIKTKECQPEEKGSGSLFSPQAKKSQRAAGSEAADHSSRSHTQAGLGVML